MAEDKVGRIFVGGLSWDTTERTLERTFGQYGKVIEAQVRRRFCPAVMVVI
jgi:heterogeneous nuclear ribonucleoprotein G